MEQPASKILTFPSTAGFGEYKKFFSKESVSHPAKANLRLLEYIVKTFTKEGETILDPMAGTYSTCVMAALLNRNGVGVELENHFYKMGLANKELTDRHQTLTPKGSITVLRGDARELTEILGSVDQIITSPPYEKTIGRQGGKMTLKNVGVSSKTVRSYDVVITSPPYDMEMRGGGLNKRDSNLKLGCQWNAYDDKVDAVITSPPYEESMGDKHHSPRADKLSEEKRQGIAYTKREVDVVLTSPPYSGALEDRKGSQKGFENGKGITHDGKKQGQGAPTPYSRNRENIGNLKGEAYFREMKIVYSQSYQVLKPQGRMILILKNCIKKWKLYDIVSPTIKICEEVGFRLEDHLLSKLSNMSFWRVKGASDWKKKGLEYPEDLRYEHVLVFQKG